MNKHLFSTVCVIAAFMACTFVTTTYAQAENTGKNKKAGSTIASAFDPGDVSLGFSLGLGANYAFDYYYSYTGGPTALPSFAVSLDCGAYEAGPGTIGFGGIIGLRSSTYRYQGGYKATFRNIVIGTRGTYHLTVLKNKNNKFDPYGGITIGVRVYNYHDNYYDETYSSAHAMAGLFIGAKYNFAKSLGCFAELGYDVSLFKFGLNVNF